MIKVKTIKNIILIIALAFLFSSCLVSRLSRPGLTGVIVDFDKKPISNCAVGETFTDKNGNFSLKERRYHEFTFIGYEAPRLFVLERINNKNYETKWISGGGIYGGGARKGAKWSLDTIYLKSTTQEIDFNNFIQHKWQLSATKNFDTLLLVKKEFNQVCKTRKCRGFYNEYSSFVDNAYGSHPNNLPYGVIQRFIDIQFLSDDVFQAKIITSYGNKGTGYAQSKPNDTLKTDGKWIINKKSIELTSAYKELNGKFNFNQAEYEFIKLTK